MNACIDILTEFRTDGGAFFGYSVFLLKKKKKSW